MPELELKIAMEFGKLRGMTRKIKNGKLMIPYYRWECSRNSCGYQGWNTLQYKHELDSYCSTEGIDPSLSDHEKMLALYQKWNSLCSSCGEGKVMVTEFYEDD